MTQLNSILSALPIFSFELGILTLCLILLVLDIFMKKGSTTLLGSLTAIGLTAFLVYLGMNSSRFQGSALSGFYHVTALDILFKGVMAIGTLITTLIILSKKERSQKPFILLLLGLLGALFVASSGELITLFLSIEIIAFASYALVGVSNRNRACAEASVKYLILGSLAACFFLFGIAWIYGVTGTTQLALIQTQLSGSSSVLVWIGFLFILAGILFKIGSFPFHFWIPDVYEAASPWVGGWLSVVSKTAGFAALAKLLFVFQGTLGVSLTNLIGILSILTILVGNLGACLQGNLKRLLGFSTIAQAGYMLLALTNPAIFGMKTVTFYLLVYTFSNLLGFAVIYLAGEEEKMKIAGLSKVSPLLALSLFVSFVSLAGIPPAAGFIGKFFLFLSAFQAKAYLAVTAGFAGILISIFYYYRVIKIAYSENETKKEISLSVIGRLLLVFLILAVLVLGIYPAPVLNIFIPHI